jgi:hypothetical protein
MRTGFWWGNIEEINRLEDLGVRWENNIKKDCKEIGCEGVGLDLSVSREGKMADFFWTIITSELHKAWRVY